ncbi:MAG: ribosomal protein S18-alanine N-acetyltransferase [Anaerolineae bacterium]
MRAVLPYLVEPMALSDLEQVMAIERVSFSLSWSERAYRYEIVDNEHSTMLVVRPAPRFLGQPAPWLRRLSRGGLGPGLGYAGFWLLVDDAHVATIAVHPDHRGLGLGALLLASLIERAIDLGANRATLEVRVSNKTAQGLYRNYGFQTVERRRRYYSDNNEDAYLMATPSFQSPAYQETLRRNAAALARRLSQTPPPPG